MAKSVTAVRTRQVPRPARRMDDRHVYGESSDGKDEDISEEGDEAATEDFNVDLEDNRERQKGKASAQTVTFQNQKKAIYAAARRNAQQISKSGSKYIEDAIANVQELKKMESTQDKALDDFVQQSETREKSMDALLSVYASLTTGLANRRIERVNSASKMLRENPARRLEALKVFSRTARIHVEEARENERIARDASALIKHYKNLLHA